MEQWRSQLALECPDGVGERRLRDAALPGGTGKVQLLAENQEIAQVSQIHDQMRLVEIAPVLSWPVVSRSWYDLRHTPPRLREGHGIRRNAGLPAR